MNFKLLSLSLFTVTLHAQSLLTTVDELPQKKTSIEMKVYSGVSNWSEGPDNGLTSSVGAIGLINHQIKRSLFASAEARIESETGRVQDQQGGIKESIFSVREAKLEYRPLDQLVLAGGALNQKYLEAPLLVSDRAFIGLRESYAMNLGAFSLDLGAQQLVPASESLDADRTEQEPTPFFFTQTAALKTNFSERFSAGLKLSRFIFSNLPSVVASDSALLGNSVVGGVGPSAKFVEDFSGYNFTARLDLNLLSNARLSGWGTWLENLASLSDSSHAQLVGGELALNFGSFSLAPQFEVYFKEADATPALYSSATYAYNNRQGYRAGLKLDVPDSKLSASFSYVQANTIFNSPVQNLYENYELRIQFNEITF